METGLATISSISIGLIGAGFMGQLAHLVNYDRLDGCRVVAIAEPRDRLRERVATRYEIEETYHDHTALCAGANVDAIVAPQPYDRHGVVVPDLLETGVPIFTEKPIAVKPETGEALAAAAERQGIPYMIGYHKPSDPAVEHAADVIASWRSSGSYGALRYIRITMPPGDWIANAPAPITTDESPPPAETEPMPEGYGSNARTRYNHIINYYIHQLNAFRLLLAESYEIQYATERLVCIESESGIEGVLELAPYETEHDWHESMLVGFDHAAIRIQLPPPLGRQRSGAVTITRSEDGTQTVTQPVFPAEWAMFRQARHFLSVVRGERDPPCGPHEAVADLRAAQRYIQLLPGEQ